MKEITPEELNKVINNNDFLRIGYRKGHSITASKPITRKLLFNELRRYIGDPIYELDGRERMLGFDYEIPSKSRGKSLLIKTRL